MTKIRGMCHRGIPWFGVLVIGVLAFGFHSVGAVSEQGQVSPGVEAENTQPQTLHRGDERITDRGSYNFYGSYGDGIPQRYGNQAATINAVGPGVAKAGDTVVIEFMISADPDDILLRAYQVTAPCALAPQDGATGTVEVVSLSVDTGRNDWAMCGAPCDCTCEGFPFVDVGDCDGSGADPRVGWAGVVGAFALVGVGPAYLAEAEYAVSGDATGSFDFEFVDPKTPDGGEGSLLRGPEGEPILAKWIGTKLVIIECTGADQCDDGTDCTVDACVEGSCENVPDDSACDDDNECTDDACDQPGPGTGCSNTNVDDGTACGSSADTECDNPDTCEEGVCEGNHEDDGMACDDGEDCTSDDNCTDGDCAGEYEVQVYADICLDYEPPDGPQPDIDDILCVVDDFVDGPAVEGCECDGFRKTTDIDPCPEDGGGDNVIDIDDILKVLDAFAGLSTCDDPCPG